MELDDVKRFNAGVALLTYLPEVLTAAGGRMASQRRASEGGLVPLTLVSWPA
jgi:hypothetical protein